MEALSCRKYDGVLGGWVAERSRHLHPRSTHVSCRPTVSHAPHTDAP